MYFSFPTVSLLFTAFAVVVLTATTSTGGNDAAATAQLDNAAADQGSAASAPAAVSISTVAATSDAPQIASAPAIPTTDSKQSKAKDDLDNLLSAPLFLEIECPLHAIGGIYSVLASRQCSIIAEEQGSGSSMVKIQAYLPADNLFDIGGELCKSTRRQVVAMRLYNNSKSILISNMKFSNMKF